MKNYSQLEDQNVKDVFTKAIDNAGLFPSVKVKVISDDKQKKLYDVFRASELVKFLGGEDVDLVVVVNEMIFHQLEDDQQQIAADQAIAGIVYDFEKDKININKPDFNYHTGVIVKYGFDNCMRLEESVKSLYDVQANKGETSSKPVTV